MVWVVTVDNNGKVVSKFSFDHSVVSGDQFALFKNGNVLVTGRVQEGQRGELVRNGAVIFSPAGAIVANLKLPFAAAGRGIAGEADRVRPISGGGDEVFLVHVGTAPYVIKVSADGTVGPKVKLAVPEDETAGIVKISGHRALASIFMATPPKGSWRTPEWSPMAEFDTETGALFDTLLAPSHEMGPICYSESGITFIRSPEGTLDSLVAQPVGSPAK